MLEGDSSLLAMLQAAGGDALEIAVRTGTTSPAIFRLSEAAARAEGAATMLQLGKVAPAGAGPAPGAPVASLFCCLHFGTSGIVD